MDAYQNPELTCDHNIDLQSHPFSVLSYESPSLKKDNMSGTTLLNGMEVEDRPVLKLMVKPCKGVTQRLIKMARQGGDHLCFLEGPYGHGLPLHNWDNVS